MRLQYRIGLSILAILLVIGVVGAAAVLQIQRSTAILQFEESALTLVSTLQDSLEHDMLEADRDHIQDAVMNIGEGKLINEVVIFSPDQKVYASAEVEEIGAYREDDEIARVVKYGEIVTRTEESYGREELCVIIPVRNKPDCHVCHGSSAEFLGAIEIGLDRAPLDKQIREQAIILILIGGLTFVGVGVALSFVLRSAVLNPLARLSSSARRIADGDFSARAGVPRNDEVGMVASTFNDMVGRVQQHAAALEDAKADLEQRVQERTEQVQQLAAVRGRLLGSLISAQEKERRRIARELHDETGQTVSSIMLELARVRDALPPDQAEAREKLSAARALAQRTLQGLRDLINDLRPEVLDQLGLEPAVRSYVRSRLESHGIKAKLGCSGLDGRLPPEAETTAFRVIQEAVANTRHSGATSVDIRMEATDSTLSAVVTDNGKGFNVDSAMQSAGSWGLRGMRERVSATGGDLVIESEPGRGTRVEFQIPLEGV